VLSPYLPANGANDAPFLGGLIIPNYLARNSTCFTFQLTSPRLITSFLLRTWLRHWSRNGSELRGKTSMWWS
jgi:hypothetical protein